MTEQLRILATCLQDAADRAMLEASVLPHSSVEGAYLLVNDSAGHTLALAAAIDPLQRPFNATIRDRARAAAARAQAPLLILCSFRTVVAHNVAELTQRKHAASHIRGIWQGALVTSINDVAVAANRVAVTEALRLALLGTDTAAQTWIHNVLSETQWCTIDAKAADLLPLLDLADVPMLLPSDGGSLELITDLMNAYVAEAHRNGSRTTAALPVLEARDGLQTLLADLLVEFASAREFGGSTVERREAGQLWLAASTGQPVPTIDAVDLALVAAGMDVASERTTAGIAHPVRVVESGISLGRLGRRLSLLAPKATVEVNSDLQGAPASMQKALERQHLGPNGMLVLHVPLAVLRDPEYAGVRRALVERFDLQWVLLSDAEPFTEPDHSMCLVVAGTVEGATASSATTFACLRMPLSGVVPAATSTEDFSEERLDALKRYLRYLRIGERDRVNAEVSVRHVDRGTLLGSVLSDASAWDDLVLPADVVSSILRKVSPSLRPLREIATITNGLRTGANDVLAPTVSEIDEQQLEEQYWQITRPDGSMADAVVIAANDELESIAGIAAADRRLLLLPADRSQFAGTQVDARLRAAEQAGVHQRPTVRNRDPWWHVPPPPVPDIIISKNQGERWLVCTNAAQAAVTDVAIGVQLHRPEVAEAVALWLNSTLGLFFHLLLRRDSHLADVTVRDTRELLVPSDDVLARLDPRRHRDFLYRPMRSLADEFGSTNADAIHPDHIRRDRRRLDRTLMEDIYQLTPEEQRWLYRLSVAWRSSNTNLRHLGTALATQLTATRKLRPMREWYSPRIAQLPTGSTRTIVLPAGVTHATSEHGMFSWQFTLWKGAKADDAIECSSESEAELLTTLINLGKRTVEIPTDQVLIDEVLPLVRSYRQELHEALQELSQALPEDVREEVAEHVRVALL